MLLALLACAAVPDGGGEDTAPPAAPDCFAEGDPRMEVALESGGFEEVSEGMIAPVSIPPQGGAPYTPWQVRVTGDGALNLGVRMVATAGDLGDVVLDLTPICANVEPNDGWWMLTGVHVRYWDYTVEELVGRTVDVHFSLQDVGGGPERAGYDLGVVLADAAGPPPL
jgi:hypothetical protein